MILEELLVFDDPVARSGCHNMALDEAIGEVVQTPILRVYGWEEPTVSFGYFEKVATVRELRPGSPLIRRWTGGGLVDHGQDWTYSLILPACHFLAKCAREKSYESIHEAIRELLEDEKYAWPSRVTSEVQPGDGCFGRPVRGDILINGQKIGGAAQRRTRRFLLHQGSLRNFATERLSAKGLAQRLANSWQYFCPAADILNHAETLSITRYSTRAWMEKF